MITYQGTTMSFISWMVTHHRLKYISCILHDNPYLTWTKHAERERMIGCFVFSIKWNKLNIRWQGLWPESMSKHIQIDDWLV